MTIAEKIVKLDEEADKLIDLNNELEQTLYGTDTGGKSFYDEFWDNYQQNGNRVDYNFAFAGKGWNDNNFKPKYNIVSNASQMLFQGSEITDLTAILEKQGVTLDLSQSSNFSSTFNQSQIERIPTVDMRKATTQTSYAFYNRVLKKVEKLIVAETTQYSNTFYLADKLEDITFDGVIGNDISFQWSTKLTQDSITSIITHLSDTTSGKILTLSKTAVNNAFSTEEWNTLVSTKSNWTITLV